MALPSQEHLDPSKSYTAEEVAHLQARWAASYQLEMLKEDLLDTKKFFSSESQALRTSISEMGVKLEASMTSLMHTIGRGRDDIEKCRKDLEEDIKNQYATKIEMVSMEGRINTSLASVKSEIKSLFIIGSVIMSGVVILANLAFKIWL